MNRLQIQSYWRERLERIRSNQRPSVRQLRQLLSRPAQPAGQIHHAAATRTSLRQNVGNHGLIFPKKHPSGLDAPPARGNRPYCAPAHACKSRNLAIAQFALGQQPFDLFHKLRFDHARFPSRKKKSPATENNFRRRALVDTCSIRPFRYPLDVVNLA
jgi:hypothetical protein